MVDAHPDYFIVEIYRDLLRVDLGQDDISDLYVE